MIKEKQAYKMDICLFFVIKHTAKTQWGDADY